MPGRARPADTARRRCVGCGSIRRTSTTVARRTCSPSSSTTIERGLHLTPDQKADLVEYPEVTLMAPPQAPFVFPLTLRRVDGTLPIRGSRASTNSHARIAASSKSLASAGSTCQLVTVVPNT